jgi:hypothetical protein
MVAGVASPCLIKVRGRHMAFSGGAKAENPRVDGTDTRACAGIPTAEEHA